MTETDNAHTGPIKPARASRAKAVPVARAATAPTKSAIVTKLLARRHGATVVEVSLATGWQAHSVRAFLSGLRKKGHALVREDRKTGVAAYRLADVSVPAATTKPVVACAGTALAGIDA